MTRPPAPPPPDLMERTGLRGRAMAMTCAGCRHAWSSHNRFGCFYGGMEVNGNCPCVISKPLDLPGDGRFVVDPPTILALLDSLQSYEDALRTLLAAVSANEEEQVATDQLDKAWWAARSLLHDTEASRDE